MWGVQTIWNGASPHPGSTSGKARELRLIEGVKVFFVQTFFTTDILPLKHIRNKTNADKFSYACWVCINDYNSANLKSRPLV